MWTSSGETVQLLLRVRLQHVCCCRTFTHLFLTAACQSKELPSQRSGSSSCSQREYEPIVQLEVILLLLGLWRSSSSSLFVGSHVEYLSPIPEANKHTDKHPETGISTRSFSFK